MALEKNTTIKIVDNWQIVAAGPSLLVGNVYDTSPNYDTGLYIEFAPVGAQAVGVEIIIEVSYADDNWVSLIELKGTEGSLNTTKINGIFSDTAVIDLIDATAGDFDVVGNKWFILNAGTPANSQSVRTKSVAGNTVTLCHDLIRAIANEDCYDVVDEWFIEIPLAAAKVRILYNNTSITQDAYVTSRVSEVTALS